MKRAALVILVLLAGCTETWTTNGLECRKEDEATHCRQLVRSTPREAVPIITDAVQTYP